ncbi:PepSY-associated TM helix domain-containing protein [Bordetella trematum]|uniref:PepSY-associated TM helix domain-containing protein n=1 Tax=Bordetella trematum TaxID=123899 RepID=UPI00398A137D
MKPKGLRQAMAWLHTWSSLWLGWLMFVIFLTGTLSYYRQEITAWMQPELAMSQPSAGSAQLALRKLAEVAPDAERWTVYLPTDRGNTLRIAWPRPQAAGAAPQARRAVQTLTLDAGSGAVLEPRATAGGEFLYRMHFELYGLSRDTARWIVGIATLAMFVALLSGVITHKKIFREFFTFRPGKALRSWLDGHNASAVLALPFYLMITYSGLVLLAATLLPWNEGGRRVPAPASEVRASGLSTATEAIPIADILAQAEQRWGQPPSRFTLLDPGTPRALLEVLPTRNDALSQQSGSGGVGDVKLWFDPASGVMLDEQRRDPGSVISRIDTSLGSLHRARFAPGGLRALFFLAGALGTLMIVTGLVMWPLKRRSPGGAIPRHVQVVDRLNIGIVAGLMVAVAAYFWANRLLPAGLAGRVGGELTVFFLAWLACLLLPFLMRSPKSAWVLQLTLAAGLYGLIPVLDLATRAGVAGGAPALLAFDALCLGGGLALLATAWRVHRHRPVVRPAPHGARQTVA